jgi:hypothetical protein
LGVYGFIAYRDKKVVGVFVRFRAPLHAYGLSKIKGDSRTAKTDDRLELILFGVKKASGD